MDLKQSLENIFTNDYPGTQSFIRNVIKPVLGDDIEYKNDDLTDRVEYAEKARKAGIKRIEYIGDLTDPNYNALNITLLDVTLNDSVNIERSRVGIQQLVRSIIAPGQHMMIVFHYEDVENKQWRFSYVYRADTLKTSTSAKRYTYVFGKGYTGHTAAERFLDLARSEKYDADFEKAFSVEALSNEFFEKYRNYYADFVQLITGKRYEKEKGAYVEKYKHAPDPQFSSTFENDEKGVRDYVKKMFGRIVFLFFLQRKGWLYDDNGQSDPQYMWHLFEKAEQNGLSDTFLDDVLKILFFNILNTKELDKRIENANLERGKDVRIIPGWDKIPYLNGGLFEDDENDRKPCKFPAAYFRNFLSFLGSYNFTIDENDPEDAEIGIDPEMLGRIFENLLEDNKDKGAFYTPKEIVEYMCRESIISYLQDERFSKEGNERIREFIETQNVELLNERQRKYVEERLIDIKVCDPAIGSGAFPMGMINILAKLFIALRLNKTIDQAKMKRYIMQNSIYGVDIEKGAVDIARLRFWLAMVVDEQEPRPLPNLRFKIMQGNSLLEYFHKIDLSFLMKSVSGNLDFITEAEREILIQDLKRYYSETDHTQRDKILSSIKGTVVRMIMNTDSDSPIGGIDVSENPRFFLWHTWFADVFWKDESDKRGFDIIIGNPPYISAPAQVANEVLNAQRQDIIQTKKYDSLFQKWDLYIAFVELGLKLLKKGGVEAMIIPYPFTNQLYGKKLRKKILDSYALREISDLKSVKVFENATVQNCILFVENNKVTAGKVRISHAVQDTRTNDLKITVDYEKELAYLEQNSKGVWDLTVNEKKKELHSGLYKFGDFCYISKGMVLNADEKSAKGEFKKDDLISEMKDDVHSRIYIEAKDISPYRIKRVRYLEWDTARCPTRLSRPTFRELYDAPKLLINCLGEFCSTIDRSAILHNHSLYCAVPWYELANVNNKSIAGSIRKFASRSRKKMEELSHSVSLQFLCAILNSSYGTVLLNEQRGGDYHIYPDHVRNIPVPIPSKELQSKINNLVDKLLIIPNLSSDEALKILKELDMSVCKAYGLSYEKILECISLPSFTQEEYETLNL